MHQYLSETVKRLRENKSGSLAIEIVIGCFIFLIVLCFLMDIMLLTWKFQIIGQTNSFVARTAGLQGGIMASAPSGFPGGNGAYISSGEMRTRIADNFAKAGINSGEYTVSVNGAMISSGASTGAIDYREPIHTEIQVKYKWAFTSNFIPGQIEHWISSKRSALSEFKYRYDTWRGE